MNNHIEIETSERLLEDGYITKKEFSEFKYDKVYSVVIDNSNCVWEITDRGDVFIHNRGGYPIILKGYVFNKV